MRDTILAAVARTLTLCAVADAWDDREESGEGLFPEDYCGAGPGDEWDECVPEGAPPEAMVRALGIVHDLEHRNGRTLEAIGEEWDEACAEGFDVMTEYEWADEDLERFGHCLAMQALGSGVSLDDDTHTTYKRPATGYFEFHAWDFDLRAFLTQD